MTLRYMGVPDFCPHGEYENRQCDKCEIEQLRAEIEQLKRINGQLQYGNGILLAAVTDEQRRRVARICYETTGICFCGCHTTELDMETE